MIPGREQERALASEPLREFVLEQRMFAMTAPEQPRAARPGASRMLERRNDLWFRCEPEIVVGCEVNRAVVRVRGNFAIPSGLTNRRKQCVDSAQIARPAHEISNSAARASKNPSTSRGLDESGGTYWIVSPIGRVKEPRS